ncbi:protein disulfide isomerase CRELD2 isoform X2 [Ranitomeya variabilis]|uniref:protein disulfide isomerase CRELD2 isoform X2 n=1 Tax=Ranitomeya variabilis TaxID=490064 RepID=UPI004055AB37
MSALLPGQKGLEHTSKSNFGGGNTAWEEKTLSRYESSEIRLVEIIENLCDSSDFECNVMVEEHEEKIEKWWFKMRKKYPDLLKWFCIETIKVCCPPGTYGPDCLGCLGGSERPCHGNGLCSGDGTRSGDGSCRCNAEYTGTFCLECADGYFNVEKNDTHCTCSACHESCKTCYGPSSNGCIVCKEGWTREDEGCADVDECATEQPPCKENQYCLNTEGSFSCKRCDNSCAGCTGEGPETCKACATGYVLEADKCSDVDECSTEQPPCKENQYCLNTEGSFSCKRCDNSCAGCTGEGPETCKACATGYVLEADKCTDINECDTSEKVCRRDNENCVNTPGSYKCVCSEGFEDKDGKCEETVETDDEEEEDSVDVHEDL